MRPILVYIFIFIVFLSCSNEDTNIYFPLKDFRMIDSDKRISNIKTSDFIHFDYNDKGLVQKIYCDSILHTECKYDIYDRLIYSKETSEKEMITYRYEYRKNQVVINVEFSSNYNNILVIDDSNSKYILHYNEIGECISNEVWFFNSILKTNTLIRYTTYTWENGNVVSMTQKYNDYESYIYNFEYDTSINPVRGLSCELIPEYAWGTNLSKNNILKKTWITSIGNGSSTYRYVYDSDNSIEKQYYIKEHNRWHFDMFMELE